MTTARSEIPRTLIRRRRKEMSERSACCAVEVHSAPMRALAIEDRSTGAESEVRDVERRTSNPLTRGTGEFRGGGRGAGRSARLCAIGVLGAALAFAAAVAATGLASSGDQRPEDSVASKRLLASYTLTQPKG